MPQTTNTSYTGTGAKAAIPCEPTHVISIATSVTGSVTYNIEVQLTPNGVWTSSTALTGLTTGLAAQALVGPISAIRVNITAGTGTVNFEAIQGYRG